MRAKNTFAMSDTSQYQKNRDVNTPTWKEANLKKVKYVE